jgi:hypothetical protein
VDEAEGANSLACISTANLWAPNAASWPAKAAIPPRAGVGLKPEHYCGKAAKPSVDLFVRHSFIA